MFLVILYKKGGPGPPISLPFFPLLRSLWDMNDRSVDKDGESEPTRAVRDLEGCLQCSSGEKGWAWLSVVPVQKRMVGAGGRWMPSV